MNQLASTLERSFKIQRIEKRVEYLLHYVYRYAHNILQLIVFVYILYSQYANLKQGLI